MTEKMQNLNTHTPVYNIFEGAPSSYSIHVPPKYVCSTCIQGTLEIMCPAGGT